MTIQLHRVRLTTMKPVDAPEYEALQLRFMSNDGPMGTSEVEIYLEIPLLELQESNSCEMQYSAQDYPTGYKVRK